MGDASRTASPSLSGAWRAGRGQHGPRQNPSEPRRVICRSQSGRKEDCLPWGVVRRLRHGIARADRAGIFLFACRQTDRQRARQCLAEFRRSHLSLRADYGGEERGSGFRRKICGRLHHEGAGRLGEAFRADESPEVATPGAPDRSALQCRLAAGRSGDRQADRRLAVAERDDLAEFTPGVEPVGSGPAEPGGLLGAGGAETGIGALQLDESIRMVGGSRGVQPIGEAGVRNAGADLPAICQVASTTTAPLTTMRLEMMVAAFTPDLG